MKKILCAAVPCLLVCTCLFLAMPNTWLKDQKDQTDTLAIPLDSSEAEEEQEEKEWHAEKK